MSVKILQDHVRQNSIVQEIREERKAQDAKWGQQEHQPSIWMAILGEEFGELCQEALRFDFGGVKDENLRTEAIQCAAVALALVECIDRNGWLEDAGR